MSSDGGGALRAGLTQAQGSIDGTSSPSAPLYVEDRDAWLRYPRDRWVYNRLELAERLGYPCGPAGVPFRWDATWFAKPIINIRGMSRGARKVTDPAYVPDGWFWMPCFAGPHVSVNYLRVTRSTRGSGWLAQEALYCLKDPDGTPRAWIRTREHPILPDVFGEIRESHQLNVEYIGDQVIEAHLRWGWDLSACEDAVAALPVWEGDQSATWPGLIEDYAETGGRRRVGFHYVR